MVVHPSSHWVPRAPWYSGYRPDWHLFDYEGFTLFAWLFQAIHLRCFFFMSVLNPEYPKMLGLGSAPFARRYLGYLG